jgi:hypothetical protein
MNSLSYNQLVSGTEYILHHEAGGCVVMKTTLKRVFFHLNEDGYPLCFDDSMATLVLYKDGWNFTQIPSVEQYA